MATDLLQHIARVRHGAECEHGPMSDLDSDVNVFENVAKSGYANVREAKAMLAASVDFAEEVQRVQKYKDLFLYKQYIESLNALSDFSKERADGLGVKDFEKLARKSDGHYDVDQYELINGKYKLTCMVVGGLPI